MDMKNQLNLPKLTPGMSPKTWEHIVLTNFKAGATDKNVGISKLYLSVPEPFLSSLLQIVKEDESKSTNLTLEKIVKAFVKSISADSDSLSIAKFNARRQGSFESCYKFAMELRVLIIESSTPF